MENKHHGNYDMGIYTAVWWVRALYLVIVLFYTRLFQNWMITQNIRNHTKAHVLNIHHPTHPNPEDRFVYFNQKIVFLLENKTSRNDSDTELWVQNRHA